MLIIIVVISSAVSCCHVWAPAHTQACDRVGWFSPHAAVSIVLFRTFTSRALELFEALIVVLNHQAVERWVANWLSLCVRVSHLHVHVHTLCDCRTFIRSIILSRTRYQQEKLQYLNWICHFVTLYWYCLYYQSSSQSIWVSFFLAMRTNDVMTDVMIIDIELYV